MAFHLTILGCGSATPTSNSHPTSQLLEMRERFFLIDCGEGAQQQLRRNKAKFSKIEAVFISHLHGDHWFGLIGLISSFHLLRRTAALKIFGPPGLEESLKLMLKVSDTWLTYPLEFVETQNKESSVIHEDDKVRVTSFPLKHSIPTTGFIFEEKFTELRLNSKKLERYKIPKEERRLIALGNDWTSPSGEVIANEEFLMPQKRALKYAFASDTAFHESVASSVENVDVLYHESTFLESEKFRARQTKHSTASQAAQIAAKAGVGRLILGHYSVRYPDHNVFLQEAVKHFPHVLLGVENTKYTFDLDDYYAIEE